MEKATPKGFGLSVWVVFVAIWGMVPAWMGLGFTLFVGCLVSDVFFMIMVSVICMMMT